MRLMPQTPDRVAAIARLELRAAELRVEIYAQLGRWQRVLVARHSNRPAMLDYVERLFTDFTELAGDRRFADDKAIVTGLARFDGRPVAVIGHQKGRDTRQKIYRNFGYAKPEGYRKALRVLKLAEKFADFGVGMAFHHHMGTFVETDAEVDRLMSNYREDSELASINRDRSRFARRVWLPGSTQVQSGSATRRLPPR